VTGHNRLLERTANANQGAFSARDWMLFWGIALIWGSSFVLIAVGLESLHPGVITVGRVGTGALALALVPAARKPIAAEDRRRLVALSILWVAIPFTLFPLAEQYINSAVTGLLNGGTPIFAALVAALFLKEFPRGTQLVGLATGFVGVILISAPSLGEGSNAAIGVVMVVLATLCYGFAINISAPLQKKYGSVTVMSKMLILATIWTRPYGIWGLRTSTFEVGPVLATLVLGVVGTGAAFAIMSSLVGSVGSTRASFITYLIPFVSLALGVSLLGDRVEPLAIAGVVLVVSGAVLASRNQRIAK
jgi:drug/metabolite transporter (DMT)-like permease